MRHHGFHLLVSLIVLDGAGAAQVTAHVPENIRLAVIDAIASVLPFPLAAEDGTPVDGSAVSRWLLQPAAPDAAPLILTIVANPPNAETQDQAARDMADIQQAVLAAERRAQDEYDARVTSRDRAVRYAPMTGVSLDDEGAAGDRADWRAQMIVEVRAVGTERAFSVPGGDSPRVTTDASGAGATVRIAEREYLVDEPGGATRHYRPEEARLYIGRAQLPHVREDTGDVHHVVVRGSSSNDAPPAIEITLRGNASLVQAVVEQATWTSVLKLRAEPR